MSQRVVVKPLKSRATTTGVRVVQHIQVMLLALAHNELQVSAIEPSDGDNDHNGTVHSLGMPLLGAVHHASGGASRDVVPAQASSRSV